MSSTKTWVIPFDYNRLTPQTLNYLNQQEQKKADSFFHPKDKKNYQLSHIYLRELLTKNYPTITPKEWQFEYNDYGKPKISTTIEFLQNWETTALASSYSGLKPPIPRCLINKELHFNISHTDSYFAMIISDKECGIDIEESGKIEITKEILDLVLTPKEQTLIKRENISFYTLWTLKEAHLKAIGRGLSISLHEIEFLKIKKNAIFKKGKLNYKTEEIKSNLYLSSSVFEKI